MCGGGGESGQPGNPSGYTLAIVTAKCRWLNPNVYCINSNHIELTTPVTSYTCTLANCQWWRGFQIRHLWVTIKGFRDIFPKACLGEINQTFNAKDVSSKNIPGGYQPNCQWQRGLQQRHLWEISTKLSVAKRSSAKTSLGDINQTVNGKEVSSKDIFGRYQPNCQWQRGLQQRHLWEISTKLSMAKRSPAKHLWEISTKLSMAKRSSAKTSLGDINQTVNGKEVSSKDIFGRYQPNCQW